MMQTSYQRLAAIGLVAAIGLALPMAASAQSFAFSIGSGGVCHPHHHHHHHRGWWAGYAVGPYWGPWYPPPAVVYASPPVVQERVIYVQPPASAPAATPYSSSASPIASALAASPASSSVGNTEADDRIVIRNMAGADLPVAFLVDGQDVELADGATRTFVGRARRTVQYDRGGNFGSTQQEITGGQYEFRITATGWDLVRRPTAIVPTRTAVRGNVLPR